MNLFNFVGVYLIERLVVAKVWIDHVVGNLYIVAVVDLFS